MARLGENVFQRGAFTFMPPRETSELQRRLWQPLAAGRVFLAGEHTSVLHAGTVHGAVVSGRQAAAQVRAAMRGEPVVAAAETTGSTGTAGSAGSADGATTKTRPSQPGAARSGAHL